MRHLTQHLLTGFSAFFLTFPAIAVYTDSLDVKIGNFYYSSPNGIAFIKSDKVAFVIDPDLGENRHTAVFLDDEAK